MVSHSNTLGKLLHEARMNRALTRKTIAEMVGVTERAILSWERDGRIPRPCQFSEICAAYGITLIELSAAIAQTFLGRGKNDPHTLT